MLEQATAARADGTPEEGPMLGTASTITVGVPIAVVTGAVVQPALRTMAAKAVKRIAGMLSLSVLIAR
jgi:hypothetical protein